MQSELRLPKIRLGLRLSLKLRGVAKKMIDERQNQIIERAARHVKPFQRDSYKKYVLDVLRGKVQPLTNTDIRSTCAASLLKFINRRTR
jgi:hypothetical protein